MKVVEVRGGFGVQVVKPASMQVVTAAVTATVLVMVKKASDVGRTIFN